MSIALLLVACARFADSPSPGGTGAAGASATLAASPSAPGPATAQPAAPSISPSSGALEAPSLDLAALRASMLGPSPVPAEWEAQVDGIIASIEDALREHGVPPVAGLDPVEAACETWEPVVGRLHWANGAVVERHVMLGHLVQLAGVAPDEIVPAADAAARVVADAAAAQLSPDGDPADISRTPRDELQAIGHWALEHCELIVTAEPDPDADDWTDDEIAQSCDLDRGLLERGQEAFRDGPGDGRYATHPHELEVSLDSFVYPAWHRIADVDNEASPPTFAVE
ncbi:MAG TPA: hypothetical protein VLA59_03230, partial [Patescibacteria group bacterium]|nr:hypothetical protein [Patescibacteria group bacterium]